MGGGEGVEGEGELERQTEALFSLYGWVYVRVYIVTHIDTHTHVSI